MIPAIHIKTPVIGQILWLASHQPDKDLVVGLIYLANAMPIRFSHKIDPKAQTYREMFHFFGRFVLVLRGVWGPGPS